MNLKKKRGNIYTLTISKFSSFLFYQEASRQNKQEESMVEIKLERGRGWKIFTNLINVTNVLNDMQDFCCLDLKCSVMICFTTVVKYVQFLMIELYAYA